MADATGTTYVYIGTYARGDEDGIYAFKTDPDTGALTPVGAVSGVANPSFLAVEPTRPCLYAVAEVGEVAGEKGGGVAAFAIDPRSGKLTPLNSRSAVGEGPCFVSVDATGRYALVANYGNGSVAMLPIEADGRLGKASDYVKHQGSSVNPDRQKEPHGHSLTPDPTNRFALACDLGLDKVLVYRLDRDAGKLPPHTVPFARVQPGAGPRHLAFHPSDHYVYVINEIDSTVTAFLWDGERGTLNEIQNLSTLPDGFKGNSSCAEIVAHPSGRFVYGSNRGHDSIAIFTVNEATGHLTAAGHEPTQGKNPRNFNLDPSGRFLYAANQDSDSVVVFRVDKETGRLTPTGETTEVRMPVCV
jgi:6-phosphogluconolactonase